MSDLSVFNFDSNEVRVISSDNPLFAANDVAAALGYSDPNRAVRQHCKGRVKRTPLQTEGGAQRIRVIYEPDVYRLIFGSKLASAQRFQDWVFEEVLPSIRKAGKYEVPQPIQTLTPAQQRHIQERVAEIVNSDEFGFTYQSLYSKIKTRFRVGTYKDIPRSRYPELCRCLRTTPQREPSEPRRAELPPAQMFHGLCDGRYLLIVDGGRTSIRDASEANLVNGSHAHILRRNCQTLARQMRACFGEADAKTMELSFEALPEVMQQ